MLTGSRAYVVFVSLLSPVSALPLELLLLSRRTITCSLTPTTFLSYASVEKHAFGSFFCTGSCPCSLAINYYLRLPTETSGTGTYSLFHGSMRDFSTAPADVLQAHSQVRAPPPFILFGRPVRPTPTIHPSKLATPKTLN